MLVLLVKWILVAIVVAVLLSTFLFKNISSEMLHHVRGLASSEWSDLRTGDILLFGSYLMPHYLVLQATNLTYYYHVAMVYRTDHPPAGLERDPAGIYIWQISLLEGDRMAHLCPLQRFLGEYHRLDYVVQRKLEHPLTEAELDRRFLAMMAANSEATYSLACVGHALGRVLAPLRRLLGLPESPRRKLRKRGQLYCSQLVGNSLVGLGACAEVPKELLPVDFASANNLLHRGVTTNPGWRILAERRLPTPSLSTQLLSTQPLSAA